jgi:hypothetical protein
MEWAFGPGHVREEDFATGLPETQAGVHGIIGQRF